MELKNAYGGDNNTNRAHLCVFMLRRIAARPVDGSSIKDRPVHGVLSLLQSVVMGMDVPAARSRPLYGFL